MQSLTAAAAAEFSARLRAARMGIEADALVRIRAIVGPAADADPDCAARLRPAVGTTLEYVATAIEQGESPALTPPPALAQEIHRAACCGVDLATMLRC